MYITLPIPVLCRCTCTTQIPNHDLIWNWRFCDEPKSQDSDTRVIWEQNPAKGSLYHISKFQWSLTSSCSYIHWPFRSCPIGRFQSWPCLCFCQSYLYCLVKIWDNLHFVVHRHHMQNEQISQSETKQMNLNNFVSIVDTLHWWLGGESY